MKKLLLLLIPFMLFSCMNDDDHTELTYVNVTPTGCVARDGFVQFYYSVNNPTKDKAIKFNLDVMAVGTKNDTIYFSTRKEIIDANMKLYHYVDIIYDVPTKSDRYYVYTTNINYY